MTETIPSTALDNLAYVEALYGRYLRDQQSVPEAWRSLFAGLAATGRTGQRRRGLHFARAACSIPGRAPAASRRAPRAWIRSRPASATGSIN